MDKSNDLLIELIRSIAEDREMITELNLKINKDIKKLKELLNGPSNIKLLYEAPINREELTQCEVYQYLQKALVASMAGILAYLKIRGIEFDSPKPGNIVAAILNKRPDVFTNDSKNALWSLMKEN